MAPVVAAAGMPGRHPRRAHLPGHQKRRRRILILAVFLLVAYACGDGTEGGPTGRLTIYSSVTQDTVDVVVESFEEAHPDITVEVFRAPTGELTARIAAEQRAGGLAADVLWLTDPLSMQQYQADGLLLAWDPEEMEAVPSEYRTETFFGTRILNLVVVHQPGVEVEDWSDLPSQDGQVALPDPGFAGSAFAAVAYFMQREGYGPEFYREMARGGGIQVQSPGDVVFGVAEGTYVAGVTLDRLARDAIADGSPLDVTWPSSGAIAIYSPIAVVAGSDGEGAGRSFLNHTLGIEAQEAIARTGWQPIRPDVEWETRGPAAGVDWESAFDRQDELLDGYRAAFGG